MQKAIVLMVVGSFLAFNGFADQQIRQNPNRAAEKNSRISQSQQTLSGARRYQDSLKISPRSKDSRPQRSSVVTFGGKTGTVATPKFGKVYQDLKSKTDVQKLPGYAKKFQVTPQDFGPTNTGSYVRDLLPANGEVGVLSQIEDRYSNNVILTQNSKGKYKVFLYIDDYLGWVSPQDEQLLTCDTLKVYRQDFVQPPLVDCKAYRAMSAISRFESYPSGSGITDGFGTYYYPNGSILRDSAGDFYYWGVPGFAGVKLKDRFLFSSNGDYFWADGTKMVYNGFLGGLYSYYPDGRDFYDVLGDLNYWNGRVYAHNTGAWADTDYSDGLTGLAYSAAGTNYIQYSSNQSPKYPSIFEHIVATGESSFFYKSGRWFKDEHGVCYNDADPQQGMTFATANYTFDSSGLFDTPVPSTQELEGYPDDFTKAENDERDYVGVYQTEDTTDTSVTHVFMQNRQATALGYPIMDPTNLKVKSITYTEATLSWADPVDSGNQSYVISLAIAPDMPKCNDQFAFNAGWVNEFVVDGLFPGVSYNFIVCGSDSLDDKLGTVVSPGVTTFGTTPSQNAAAPINIKTLAHSPTSLTIGWEPGDNVTDGYSVTYAEGLTAPTECPLTGVGGGNSVVLSPLKPNTPYSILICAFVGNKLGGSAQWIDFTDAAPVVAPVKLVLAPVATGMSVSFTTSNPEVVWSIQYTTNLKTWTVGKTFPVDANKTKVWVDTDKSQKARFYRAVSQ